MTATNHALTGALIGLIVGEPLIAVPAAFASHFVCDALPHYGRTSQTAIKTAGFQRYLVSDAALCVLLVLVLAVALPEHWLLAAVCAFLAASPDFFWINRYLKIRADKPWRPNAFSRFAKRIQWFERPIGAVVEAAWFVGAVILLAAFIHP